MPFELKEIIEKKKEVIEAELHRFMDDAHESHRRYASVIAWLNEFIPEEDLLNVAFLDLSRAVMVSLKVANVASANGVIAKLARDNDLGLEKDIEELKWRLWPRKEEDRYPELIIRCESESCKVIQTGTREVPIYKTICE